MLLMLPSRRCIRITSLLGVDGDPADGDLAAGRYEWARNAAPHRWPVWGLPMPGRQAPWPAGQWSGLLSGATPRRRRWRLLAGGDEGCTDDVPSAGPQPHALGDAGRWRVDLGHAERDQRVQEHGGDGADQRFAVGQAKPIHQRGGEVVKVDLSLVPKLEQQAQ